MRILFMGTPEFAVASLKALVEAGHEICGVFTQPDKPKNRGHKLAFSPVKEYALSQNLPVYQPLKLRDGTALALVQELHPELIVVAAYGRILPEDILNMPPYGSINVHSSILPKYRGSAPINWAVLNGEKVTAELDAGDIIRVAETPIDPDEDAQTLTARLALLGADALVQTVHDLTAGTASRTPQEHDKHTYAPMLDKSMSPMDFTKPAQQLHDQVRGLIPWPCATMELNGASVKVYRTAVGEETAAAPGVVVETRKALLLPAATVSCCGFWSCKHRAASACPPPPIWQAIRSRSAYERKTKEQRPRHRAGGAAERFRRQRLVGRQPETHHRQKRAGQPGRGAGQPYRLWRYPEPHVSGLLHQSVVYPEGGAAGAADPEYPADRCLSDTVYG